MNGLRFRVDGSGFMVDGSGFGVCACARVPRTLLADHVSCCQGGPTVAGVGFQV